MENAKKYSRKTIFAISALLLTIAIVGIVLAVTLTQDNSNTARIENTNMVYRIKNVETGQYLENKTTGNTNMITLNDKMDDLDQYFSVEKCEDNKHCSIKNVNTLDGLGMQDGKLMSGAFENNENQHFVFEEMSGDMVKIKNRTTGKYLTASNMTIDERESTNEKNQLWKKEMVEKPFSSANEYVSSKYNGENDKDVDRIYKGAEMLGFERDEVGSVLGDYMSNEMALENKLFRIKSTYSGYYWNIDKDSHYENEKLMLGAKTESFAQIFRFVKAENDPGYYNIVNCNSNLVLDCFGLNSKKNEKVIQFRNLNQDNQKFKVQIYENNVYKFQLKHSGFFLTIKQENRNPGAEVVQWPFIGGTNTNQDWVLEEYTHYNDLDEFLVDIIKNKKYISTNILMGLAKGVGFNPDEEYVKTKTDEIIDSLKDDVFTDKTGFVTTYDMLNKSVDKIAFAGAHNAFSNNEDRRSSLAWDTYSNDHSTGTMNHDISIKTMLEVGYRFIDLDIGDNGNGHTGCYHRYRLRGYTNFGGSNSILEKMMAFLRENPSEILIMHFSDVYTGTIDLTKLRNNAIYHPGDGGYYAQFNRVITDLKNDGALPMVYNFNGNYDASFNDLFGSMKVPGKDMPWPTLKDMIKTNKRILYLRRDDNISIDLPFKNQNEDPNNTTPENLNMDQNFLNRARDSKNQLINSGYVEDWGASAGDKNAAKINNNGRRIYDILTKADNTFKDAGIDHRVNTAMVDFATGNAKQNGFVEISPVDAVNKANYRNFGYDWTKEKVGQWYW